MDCQGDGVEETGKPPAELQRCIHTSHLHLNKVQMDLTMAYAE